MVNNLEDWTYEKLNNKKLSLWNKSKFILKNEKCIEFIKVDLDKDLKYDNIERCDFILIIDSLQKVFYIELKWNHRDKAIKQIENTLNNIYFNNNCENYWYIICSSVPKESSYTQTLKLQLKKKYNLILDIKSSLREVNI